MITHSSQQVHGALVKVKYKPGYNASTKVPITAIIFT